MAAGFRSACRPARRSRPAGARSMPRWMMRSAWRSHTTLAVNCLPMGVGFSSDRMTVATTSVREDMAVALIKAFGRVVRPAGGRGRSVVRQPVARPCRRRAGSTGGAIGCRWCSARRRSASASAPTSRSCLGLDLDRPERGYVMSSFGVGELGLHLLFETPATIAVRRALAEDPALAHDLGMSDGARLPRADDVRVSPVAYVSGDRRAQMLGIRTARHLDARPGAADSAAALSDGGRGAAP